MLRFILEVGARLYGLRNSCINCKGLRLKLDRYWCPTARTRTPLNCGYLCADGFAPQPRVSGTPVQASCFRGFRLSALAGLVGRSVAKARRGLLVSGALLKAFGGLSPVFGAWLLGFPHTVFGGLAGLPGPVALVPACVLGLGQPITPVLRDGPAVPQQGRLWEPTEQCFLRSKSGRARDGLGR